MAKTQKQDAVGGAAEAPPNPLSRQEVEMKVNLDPIAAQVPAEKAKPATPVARPAASKVTATIQSGTAVSSPIIAATSLSPNVTFRRDANGQVYYVLTDANSGKELREVPAQEIRKVGEGIAEYLKHEQEKNTAHVEVKA